ncbi:MULTISPECIES: ATP phosphoribosyltransferase [Saccharopolyspora]|uniref:ATP phosphoribosyltransferase n=1 Tax=Saccharopolyspora gregorii TaxID=33914 RepID=A0ABP6RVV0_9PSEU|nr:MULTISPECIES: ATP phosphoribosyltransferase [Saccharopolyspora]MCA1188083.1 ATP phosphoribosyltransferase [Saccharopolyspora sp. 6T]MCA1194018.1 ATP phosphoribosyltransferase [Saccharopolyspora sp. 6V]MCA1225646.1 ATP phosphoribosyltransferase [Saccharopolyspora sp. 6M]MCA1281264.1 ATP phosphoribosyltransferase [Saccharopolyspora sp. 7B]
MLRVAVPNKGSLSGPAIQLLSDAGYRVHREHKALFATDTANDVQFVFLRPTDIARTVGSGVLDVGITGQDLLQAAGTDVSTTELLPLDFGVSRFFFAAPTGRLGALTELDGKRIATSFAPLVSAAAADLGIEVEIIELDGAVETAVELGLADAIADVVETGASLREAGLQTVGEPILRSEAVLVRGTRDLPADSEQAIEKLIQRLRGVLIARQYVMMDYNCPTASLDAARKITPGMEAPTVSPLDEQGWVAVRVMVPRHQAQTIMDSLWAAGARAILVTPLEACRL